MTACLTIYLIGFLPAFVLYARWDRSITIQIMRPYDPGSPGDSLVIGALCALLWPVGWTALLTVSAVCGVPGYQIPVSVSGSGWLARQIFRGM